MDAVHILDLEIARGEHTRLTSILARSAFVVTFEGSALVRGGGLRCLTMPITPQSPLVQRAIDAVAREPVPTQELARQVFGLRQAPPGLAACGD
jgi:hypothetical protein